MTEPLHDHSEACVALAGHDLRKRMEQVKRNSYWPCANRTGCETPNDCRDHRYCRSTNNAAGQDAIGGTQQATAQSNKEVRPVREEAARPAAPTMLEEHDRLLAENERLRATLQLAQAMRPSLLKDYGAVPECVLDFCNRARAALAKTTESA